MGLYLTFSTTFVTVALFDICSRAARGDNPVVSTDTMDGEDTVSLTIPRLVGVITDSDLDETDEATEEVSDIFTLLKMLGNFLKYDDSVIWEFYKYPILRWTSKYRDASFFIF
jgi:hypothetical protein